MVGNLICKQMVSCEVRSIGEEEDEGKEEDDEEEER